MSQHQRRQAALSAPASCSSSSASTTSPSQTSLQPSTATPRLSAVFQVHLKSVNPRGPEAQKLLDWVFQSSTELGIELIGVYQTKSMTLIFESSWVLWAHLNGFSGFELVCEPVGGNLLKQMMSKSMLSASMAESLNFSGS